MTVAEPIAVRGAGFATPESVYHDPDQDYYLVSNINGAPLAEDDNGFISLVAPDGRVLALKWIDGASDSVTLHAPKGMAMSDTDLFVADITTIRRFDRKTGAPRGEIPVPGASFLNDLFIARDGSLYITDSGLQAGPNGFEPSGTDAVYRLGLDGQLVTLLKGDSLGRPNGIAVSGDSIWVVSFGSGELYRVTPAGRADVTKLAKGSLDGLILRDNEVFISSWDGQAVYRGVPGGAMGEAVKGLVAPADIALDAWRQRLLIPLFNDNELRIVPLTPW